MEEIERIEGCVSVSEELSSRVTIFSILGDIIFNVQEMGNR
jgi:hypothetical protein